MLSGTFKLTDFQWCFLLSILPCSELPLLPISPGFFSAGGSWIFTASVLNDRFTKCELLNLCTNCELKVGLYFTCLGAIVSNGPLIRV